MKEEKNKKRYWLTQGMNEDEDAVSWQKVEEMVIVERGK